MRKEDASEPSVGSVLDPLKLRSCKHSGIQQLDLFPAI